MLFKLSKSVLISTVTLKTNCYIKEARADLDKIYNSTVVWKNVPKLFEMSYFSAENGNLISYACNK